MEVFLQDRAKLLARIHRHKKARFFQFRIRSQVGVWTPNEICVQLGRGQFTWGHCTGKTNCHEAATFQLEGDKSIRNRRTNAEPTSLSVLLRPFPLKMTFSAPAPNIYTRSPSLGRPGISGVPSHRKS